MSEKKRTIISIVLFLGFVCLFQAGYINGEAAVVLQKARNICMECIGIG